MEEQKCKICGCTEDDCRECISKTGRPCHWVEENLCSACVGIQKQAIAIIDLSNSSLTILDVDDKLNSEEIEDLLNKKGFHLSNCSWGAFDGEINDER